MVAVSANIPVLFLILGDTNSDFYLKVAHSEILPTASSFSRLLSPSLVSIVVQITYTWPLHVAEKEPEFLSSMTLCNWVVIYDYFQELLRKMNFLLQNSRNQAVTFWYSLYQKYLLSSKNAGVFKAKCHVKTFPNIRWSEILTTILLPNIILCIQLDMALLSCLMNKVLF